MFVKPSLEYGDLLPVLVVLGVACLGIVVEAFFPREQRRLTQVSLAVIGLVVALVRTVLIGTGPGHAIAEGALSADGPTMVVWGLVLVVSLGGVLLFAERQLTGASVFAGQAAALPGTAAEREASQQGLEHTEVYPLLMFAVAGMMLFAAADDLLMLFVGLEVLSLPLYILTGLARQRRLLSQEAAMKYFLLGAFSSGFLVYGLAMVYGYAGSMSFTAIAAAHGPHALLLLGMGLMAVGLLFKVGAVPFHGWTPDVYQGAPTPVTAWMSAATKIAAFGALLRLVYIAFGHEASSWRPTLGIIAVITMLLGSAFAVVQSDVKRMLGYSAVAHTGFLLTGAVGLSTGSFGGITSTQAVLFYLTSYAAATVGAFAIASLVRGRGGAGGEAGALARWAGLGRRSPLVAGAFAVLLLSMAGIPLTGGFIGKWAVFSVALAAGQWPVVVLAVASSIVAVFFYVRVILVMFFAEPELGIEQGEVARPSLLTSGTIAVTVAATFFLGVVPDPVLHLLGNAGSFIG